MTTSEVRNLTPEEKKENIRCKVTKRNRMACNKCATAFVVVAMDKLEVYKQKYICNYHLAMLNHGITEEQIGSSHDNTAK